MANKKNASAGETAYNQHQNTIKFQGPVTGKNKPHYGQYAATTQELRDKSKHLVQGGDVFIPWW